MKVTVSESKGLKTNLNVLVKKQEIDKKIEERVIELQKTVNIKAVSYTHLTLPTKRIV